MRRGAVSAVLFVSVLVCLSGSTNASSINAPHDEANDVSCEDCHSNPLPDTNRSAVCETCHGAGGSAPQVLTHSNEVIKGYAGWEAECLDCHDPHFQYQLVNLPDLYLISGTVDGYSDNHNGTSTFVFDYSSATINNSAWELPPDGNADWGAKTSAGRGLILVANKANPDETFEIVSANATQITVNGVMASSPVGNNFGIIYGQLLKAEIYTEAFIAGTGKTSVKFYEHSGENAFADGVAPHDGICQVCHDNTNHFTRDGDVNTVSPGPGVMDHTDYEGTNCTGVCHTHASGFGLGGGSSCGSCHENWGSHPTHIEEDYGPRLACYDCHDADNYPYFKSGTGGDGAPWDLSETDVCDPCHSPGGAFNGVDTTGDSVGAKDNWVAGVYEVSSSSLVLQSGKEKWCVGCHDDDPAVIAGVSAPNVAGDDIDYGYYKTGHGKHGNEQAIGCLRCHDAAMRHTDGEARTYTAAADNYQIGYRLKSVDGQKPMEVPRNGTTGESNFRLCFSCHDSAPFLTQLSTDTNFRKDFNDDCATPPDDLLVNKHWYHLQGFGALNNQWDSDWDGSVGDSHPSCPACHNVHGPKLKTGTTNAPAMVRTGELIGRSSALNLSYFTNACPDQTFSTTNETAGSTGGSLKLYGGGGGTIPRNGVCVMCHTEYAPYWREAKAVVTDCETCHGHDVGYEYEVGKFGQGKGTFQSHSTHTENDTDDLKGPHIDCDDCHDINNIPYFKSGTGGDGPPWDLSETDVCDTCHSPGGTYNGLNDPAVGAKIIWHTGAYAATDDSTLATGKEKWCASCHDEMPSVIGGVSAPNIVGDEDAFYVYGKGWGYYKTGHGLAGGNYPASGAPAAKQKCSGCHDQSTRHIDNEARTYSVSSDNYQAGYRLRDVNGGSPMIIPRLYGAMTVSEFALCFECHDSDLYLNEFNFATNFRSDVTSINGHTPVNAHWYHVEGFGANKNKWRSDWDYDNNPVADSYMSCPACHNVHGSPSPMMVRHGELISTPGTTDKVPALGLEYTPEGTYPVLAESIGGTTRWIAGGSGTIAKNGVCFMCHPDQMAYIRTASDIYSPKINSVFGEVGSDILTVTFSEGVYSDSDATGNLVSSDFILVDTDDSRTITGVTHTAGGDNATLTLSSSLDADDDIDTDSLAAASTVSIYDTAGNPMSTAPVTISGDAEPPTISNLDPVNGASDVAINNDLTFTLSDDGAGIDWTTLSVQLSGTLGYSETYTETDTVVVTRTGTPASYNVTVNADTFFSNSETITITVNVDDLAGNSLTPAAWSFTTTGGTIWEKPDAVYNSYYFGGSGNLIDDNLVTGNYSTGGTTHYATYKLDKGGDLYSVTDVRLYGGPTYTRTWRVYTSLDGYDYTLITSSWIVGGASQWYEYAFPTPDTTRYIRIETLAASIPANLAFEFQFKGSPVINSNGIPVLSWTGETNYTNDGVHPDSALGASNFEFRVSYTDADDEAPTVIKVWVDEDDDGQYEDGEKYDLTEVDAGDIDFTDGKLYTTTLSFLYAGDGNLKYRFVASDGSDLATGDPTADKQVTVINNPPELSWTGETNYTTDGVNPDSAETGNSFEFRIDYADVDNTAPTSIQVWVDEDDNGTFETDEKYDLNEVDAGDTDFTDGKLYNISMILNYMGDGILYYRFYASDGVDDAVGAPVSNSIVTVTTNAPTLDWTGEPNYVSDGVDPDSDAGGSNFEFHIMYTEVDNEAPTSIQVWIDENDNNTYEAGEKYDMTAMDGSDSDYTDGKLYAKTRALAFAGDGILNYRFYASDPLVGATGAPTLNSTLTVTADINTIPNLDWTGETNYTTDGVNPDSGASGGNFEFRIDYSDADNEAPVSMQIWVDENDNGAYEAGEKYDMTAVNGADVDYTDGKLYTKNLSIAHAGDGTLNCRFYAFDGTANATGAPALDSTILIYDPLEVPSEYSSIQAAIDAASNGDYVVVSDGTYNENINFNGKAITVRSVNGSAVTTIDSLGAGGPVVTFNSSETSSSILDGFTITNGIGIGNCGGGIYISGSSPKIEDIIVTGHSGFQYGGGMYIINGSIPTLMNVTVSNNTAAFGGGLFVDSSSTLTLTDSAVTANTATTQAGGGIYLRNSMATISSTSITYNEAVNNSGGGCYFTGSTTVVTIEDGCNISDNVSKFGGGLIATSSATVTISDSTINGNTTSYDGGAVYTDNSANLNVFRSLIGGNQAARFGGGLALAGATVELENATISGNRTSSRGGGIYISSSSAVLTMTNSTVGGNYSPVFGGGLFAGGTVLITNSIIWGNSAPYQNEIYNTVDPSNVANSDIDKDGYEGINGSIRQDPVFVSPISDPASETPTASGDYHLQSSSPCIDSGTATGAPSDDIDGDSRPVDGPDVDTDAEYDMGSDEYMP